MRRYVNAALAADCANANPPYGPAPELLFFSADPSYLCLKA